MFQALVLLAQIACMAAGLALGGASTAVGGALLLASLWFMGANLGWLFHVGKEVSDGDD